MVALVGVACSKAPADTGTGTATGANGVTANRDQAVKFAECMRTNGVKAFPDPDVSGSLTIDGVANGSSIDTNSASFKQALTACRDLEPSGFTGNKRSTDEQASALKFAQCMRDNGVNDFPDPAPDAPLIDTNQIPAAATSVGMSALHAAMGKCSSYATAAGVTGGR
jgi:hypothetical protein